MPTRSKELQLDTSLGHLTIQAQVEADHTKPEALSLKSVELEPTLPAGMSVERCRAILVHITGVDGPFRIEFIARLGSEANGQPCTGECLEAIEWSDGRSLIIIGTEDAAALCARVPGLETCPEQEIASYGPQSIQIRIAGEQGFDALMFHFIIAENPVPEPMPDSAWFAVDTPHKTVVQAF